MINGKYCIGCSCYYYTNVTGSQYYCTTGIKNDEGQCPCTLCIVKMMCQKSCLEFTEFRKKGYPIYEL